MGRLGRRLAKGILIATALAASFASAASINSAASTVGAGAIQPVRCDTDGMSATPVLTASSVAGVSLGGISASCANKTLSVGVTNGSQSGTGSVLVPSGGGTLTVPITPAVTSTTAVTIDVVITGAP